MYQRSSLSEPLHRHELDVPARGRSKRKSQSEELEGRARGKSKREQQERSKREKQEGEAREKQEGEARGRRYKQQVLHRQRWQEPSRCSHNALLLSHFRANHTSHDDLRDPKDEEETGEWRSNPGHIRQNIVSNARHLCGLHIKAPRALTALTVTSSVMRHWKSRMGDKMKEE
jgi:hypothetical protein